MVVAVGIPSQDDSVTEIYSGSGGINFTYQSEVEGAVLTFHTLMENSNYLPVARVA